MELYLRVAPELYLKRLIVGGLERVYEINRNFRNEGISTQHNPEFTMMEFYQAYADYHDLMTMTEELVESVARQTLGRDQIVFGDHPISLAAPFARLSLRDGVREAASSRLGRIVEDGELRDRPRAAALASQLGVTVLSGYGAGKITTELFEKLLVAIAASGADATEKAKLEASVQELRSVHGSPRFVDAFLLRNP